MEERNRTKGISGAKIFEASVLRNREWSAVSAIERQNKLRTEKLTFGFSTYGEPRSRKG